MLTPCRKSKNWPRQEGLCHDRSRVEEWRGGLGVALRVDRPFRLPVPEYPTMLRFHSSLIEPDVQISRIRLSDKMLMRSHTSAEDDGPRA